MRKTTLSFVMLSLISLSMQAQVDGVSFKKVKTSQHLKEYEVAYFNDKPVVTGRSGVGIKTDYYNFHYMLNLFQQKFMTPDSLLSANDIANQKAWFEATLRRNGDATEKDKKLQLGYQFDKKLRTFLNAHLNKELAKQFFGSSHNHAWGATDDQFKRKKVYEDFLKLNLIADIKEDINSFSMAEDLIYIGYGGIGAYDFENKELLFTIRTDHIVFPEGIKKNEGGTLYCRVKMNEEEAQRIIEKKHYRALIPVKPATMEINTIVQYLTDKEPIDRRYFMTELNGNEIELIGSLDAQDKIITIDVKTCVTM